MILRFAIVHAKQRLYCWFGSMTSVYRANSRRNSLWISTLCLGDEVIRVGVRHPHDLSQHVLGHHLSSIQYPISNIQYPVSSIPFIIQYPISPLSTFQNAQAIHKNWSERQRQCWGVHRVPGGCEQLIGRLLEFVGCLLADWRLRLGGLYHCNILSLGCIYHATMSARYSYKYDSVYNWTRCSSELIDHILRPKRWTIHTYIYVYSFDARPIAMSWLLGVLANIGRIAS